MNAALKIVTQLPLKELWRDDGFKTNSRIRSLTEEDIGGLLRTGSVQFVIADVASPLRWVSVGECYEFWKTEVKPHLAAPESRASLENFSDNYFYLVSEWGHNDGTTPLIVCEKHH